jgi:hypothetical protein
MKTKRNFWPYGILLAFALFISGTAALIVIACSNDADLVSEKYYEEEIQFQVQIDRVNRASERQSRAQVTYDPLQKRISVALPLGQASGETRGRIQLYRPSSSGLDQTLELKPDAAGVQFVDAAQLRPGRWTVKVFWTEQGEEYQVDENVVIAAKES